MSLKYFRPELGDLLLEVEPHREKCAAFNIFIRMSWESEDHTKYHSAYQPIVTAH